MSLNEPPRQLAKDGGTTPTADAVIWVHAAFCGMALPMRGTREAWRRDIGTASVRIEPGAGDDPVPSGRILRLSLMHLCDAAFRSKSPVVELGIDAAMLAAALGVGPVTPDLTDQWQRLHAARIAISWNGGPEFSVFDARSRPRAGGAEWRSGVRLNNRFLASLLEHAVPLDARVVRAVSATPAALDAHAWIRLLLRDAAADEIVSTDWNDLMARFGTPAQDAHEFRAAFEAALRVVFEADRSIALAVDDEGVSVRHAEQVDDESTTAGPAPRQPGADVVDPSPAPRREQPVAPPSPTPVVAAAEVARPAVQGQRQPASQPGAEGDQAAAADRIKQDNISLPRHLTGLAQVIWLRRGHGEECVLVGVTPNPRFEPERLTVLAVEPIVMQVSGGLNEKDFERVSAWVMTNRDLIDDFWEGRITSFAEMNRRVRKAPAPGWR